MLDQLDALLIIFANLSITKVGEHSFGVPISVTTLSTQSNCKAEERLPVLVRVLKNLFKQHWSFPTIYLLPNNVDQFLVIQDVHREIFDKLSLPFFTFVIVHFECYIQPLEQDRVKCTRHRLQLTFENLRIQELINLDNRKHLLVTLDQNIVHFLFFMAQISVIILGGRTTSLI